MTEVVFKNKKYAFSWRGIALFAILCPLIALIVFEIFDYYWVYIHPLIISPVCDILSLITGTEFTFYRSNDMYWFIIPGQPNVGFASACAGAHGYAIYAGICIATMHNKNKNENKNIWLRKFYTFLIPTLLFSVANILRAVIALYFYYNGAPFEPNHEYLGYFTTFFAVFVFYLVCYYLLPEFPLFIVWIKNSVKNCFSGKPSEKIKTKEILDVAKKKETKKPFLLITWLIISIILAIIICLVIV